MVNTDVLSLLGSIVLLLVCIFMAVNATIRRINAENELKEMQKLLDRRPTVTDNNYDETDNLVYLLKELKNAVIKSHKEE